MHESIDTISEISLYTENLIYARVQEYKFLLEQMKALEKVTTTSHQDQLERLSAEITDQERKCRKIDLSFQQSTDRRRPGTRETDLYQSLFTIMEAIQRVNKRIAQTLNATMTVTAEELKKIKKALPAISGYATTQNTGPRPVLKRTG